MNLAERYEVYKNNVNKEMLYTLAQDLGVTTSSLEKLGIGFYPKFQTWIFPERNIDGDVIGLTQRAFDGKKLMVKGSRRGLFYEYNNDSVEGDKRYEAGRLQWIRIADVGVTCPVCAKHDWCLVSSDDPKNPSAAVCSRISSGSVRELSGCGHIHILDKKRQNERTKTSILQISELPIIIVEGASDVLSAMDLGFVAIGRPSAEGGMELLKEMPLSGKEIWIIGENDAGAGRAGMEKTYVNIKHLSENIFCIMPPEGVKDLRQWVKQGLTQEELFKYVGENAVGGGVYDPDTFDDDVAFNIAKRFIESEMTDENGKQLLRHYKGSWVKFSKDHYDDYDQQKLRGNLYRYLDGKRYVRETSRGVEISPYKPTARKISDIVDSFSYMSPITVDPPEWLDRDREDRPGRCIAFTNGILDVDEYLRSGRVKLIDPTPEYFTLATFPYAYDPKAESQLFDDFLITLFNADDEIIRLVDQWFGYNIIPDNSFEKFMLYTGPPRSGKSTLIDTMSAMIGKAYTCSTSFQSMISPHGCTQLIGKLSATLGDAQTPRASEASTALELMLKIIGGDSIEINPKYRDAFSTRLCCRFTIAMNELPGFSDHAGALASRLNIIDFPNSYVGCEDFTLKNRVIKEAKEGRLINRALRGLKDLYDMGYFVVPESSKEIITTFSEITNPILAFTGECCIISNNDGDRVFKDELYEAWSNWCKGSGRKSGSKQSFLTRVGRMFHHVKSTQLSLQDGTRPYVFTGIRLKSAAVRKYLA